jgi:hypothetical protein
MQKSWPKVSNACQINTMSQAAIGMSIILIAGALEWIVPEMHLIPKGGWSPALSGLILGSLNLPLSLFLNKSMGCTTSFKIVLGEFVHGLHHFMGCNLSYLHLPRIPDTTQLFFVLGIVSGSLIAGANNSAAVPSASNSIFGGFLLGFGANIIGGCTSGHGLSGTSMLMYSSFLVLPSLFIGAMGTALVRKLLMS